MKEWFMVAIGGMIGSLARHGINVSFNALGWNRLPMGTLAANLMGCFLIGLAWRLAERHGWIGGPWELAFRVGVLGGLTTFSTYGLDVVRYAQQQHYGLAAWVVTSNLALGLLAVLLGMWVVRPAV